MRDELKKYAEECGDRFKLWHALSKVPDDQEWPYKEGPLTQELM